jgi:hypothetical protein
MTVGERTTAGVGAVAAGLGAGLAATGFGPGRSFPSGLAFCVAAGLETPAGLSFPDELEAGLGDELVEEAEEVLPELEPPVEEDEVVVDVVAAALGAGAGLGFGLGFGVVVVAAGVVSVGAGSGAGSSASARGAKAAASAAPARTAAAWARIALDAGRAPQLTASILPSSLSP